MRRVAVIGFAAAVVALSVAGQATAQPADAQSRRAAVTAPADSALEAQTAAVASTLRCPVCQGESIQDSPSELALQMRGVVRERLRAGDTPEQVKAYFVSRYGEWILLEPTMKGLNIALYVLPVLLVVGGLALVAFLVKRWTAPEATQ